MLPMRVRVAIFAAYSSLNEIASLPKDIWKTPSMKVSSLDYESYWENRDEGSIQPRYRVIAHIIPKGSSVLEVGCGDGLLMEFLERTRDAKCKGYDVSEESVRVARERGLDAEVADVTSIEFQLDCKYDYVLACELLEHLSDPELLVIKVRQYTTQSIIVSVPNVGYFRDRLRLLFGRFPVQWVVHPSEHLRFWSVLDFRWWASEMGLTIVKVWPANGLRLLNLYKVWPKLFANDIVYVLECEPISND